MIYNIMSSKISLRVEIFWDYKEVVMKQLENNCIILRDLELNDANDMYEYAKDDRVGPSAGWPPHINIEETENVIQKLIESKEVWGIYYKEKQKLIGIFGVHFGKYPITDTKVHALGFELNPDYWGKGIMKMACDLVLEYVFSKEEVLEVYANHFNYNKRSGSFIKKYGMELVGTWYRKSMVVENVLYKLTKNDFMKNKQV
jgi:putative acetyltransferase